MPDVSKCNADDEAQLSCPKKARMQTTIEKVRALRIAQNTTCQVVDKHHCSGVSEHNPQPVDVPPTQHTMALGEFIRSLVLLRKLLQALVVTSLRS